MSQVLRKVKQCEGIIGYEFKEKRHCVNALYAYSGHCSELGVAGMIKKNDGLAIFGDIVLQYHLCQNWLEKSLSRQQWSQIRQKVGSNANLGSVGKAKGLDACVVLNPGTTTVSENVMATTVEAIIGAVSLDGEKADVEGVLERLDLSHGLLKVVPPVIEVFGSPTEGHPGPLGIRTKATMYIEGFGSGCAFYTSISRLEPFNLS